MQLFWLPVTLVQYTYTYKQYTEQHNETEYPEQNIHKNKNRWTLQLEYVIYKIKQKHTSHTTVYSIMENGIKNYERMWFRKKRDILKN
jgi:hypothetical protein